MAKFKAVWTPVYKPEDAKVVVYPLSSLEAPEGSLIKRVVTVAASDGEETILQAETEINFTMSAKFGFLGQRFHQGVVKVNTNPVRIVAYPGIYNFIFKHGENEWTAEVQLLKRGGVSITWQAPRGPGMGHPPEKGIGLTQGD